MNGLGPSSNVRLGRHAETPHRRAREHLARAKRGRREVRLVGGVGKALGLQRDAVPLPVGAAAGPHFRAVEEVARVHLKAGLVGVHLQGPSGGGVRQYRGGSPGPRTQHEVVVIAPSDPELLVGVADAVPDRTGLPEVQGSPGHLSDAAGGDQVRPHRRVVVCVDP